MLTKEAFLDECRRVAAEMNAKRKAEGSTVDLTTGYYADVGASAWATIWQAIEDKSNSIPVMRVIGAHSNDGDRLFQRMTTTWSNR